MIINLLRPNNCFWACMILFGSLLLSGCQKDHIFCTYENEFCAAVHQGEFEQSAEYMDLYLSEFDYKSDFEDDQQAHEKKLNQLKQWMECKDCIQSVEVICVSCIYTNPAQSELGIEYLAGEGIVYKVMDVRMSSPMAFGGFHE